MRIGSTGYSLCGVTHTICSAAIMDALGSLALAPVEPWDALVCTSQAAKRAVERVLETWADYLAARLGGPLVRRFELPQIPLGVDCDRFETPSDLAMREQVRSTLSIATDDIAILFVGRLSYHAKAHPLPMYVALEEVARRTQKRLHLMQFGWFANPELKNHFVAAAKTLCPTVTTHFLDDRNDWQIAIWHAADIFTSLSDNIQETFGLTPLEAMAAGLPLVVSDWDGYRDTVRHGIDGFRAPTLMPPGGCGDELVARYELGIDSYDRYIGNTSQSVAVDVGCCVRAFEQLIESESLRKSMGEAARQRARSVFDWRVVIKSYQELWQELAARRAKADPQDFMPRCPPLRQDPFAVFGHYATRTLDQTCWVQSRPNATAEQLDEISRLPMNSFALPLLLSASERKTLLEAIANQVRVQIGDLVDHVPRERQAAFYRTLGWLAKMDLIRLEGLGDAHGTR